MSINSYVGDLSYGTVLIRLALAVLCSAILGYERTRKLRVAGLRTFLLIGIGACIVMMTGIYVHEYNPSENATRLPAQVISGISFVGAGTIILTGTSQVKGLTTAAGLWANAALCLAAGAGLYTVALSGLVLAYLCMTLVAKFQEHKMRDGARVRIFTVIENATNFKDVFTLIRSKNINIAEFEAKKVMDGITGISIILDLPDGMNHEDAVRMLDESGYCLFTDEN